MKKVLFATTALVASAGIAAAEVNLSGSAEMGVVGGSAQETQFHTDIDVTFKMEGTTDNGLTFGASIDLDESDGSGSCTLPGGILANGAVACSVSGASPAFAEKSAGGETIFISGDFGTITMGDTDSGFDAVLDEIHSLGGAGSIDGAHEANTSDGDGVGQPDSQTLSYKNTFNGLEFVVSINLDDAAGSNDHHYSIGVGYTFDLASGSVDLGLGYSDAGAADAFGFSAVVKLDNGFAFGGRYEDASGASNEAWGVGVGYKTGAYGFNAQYSEKGGVDGWGVAAQYDLGGAKLQAGYGDVSGGASTWSLGVAMKF
ncbi:hypothetical protein ACMU_02880 [Actibacterium mucosum KCTC 23349]|uniref:Porin domain-containing protein n=1 Tax=Actibacterium mucosum KCTC 23349 TaxID=1454373 RepID=A0A037ZP84_9RHOB|nr:porin [Actibacterium mucosum]KAJ57465.1 hypothetical protein ACMU_02880 [Actibacterium mucosum KCTC 23349]